MVDGIGGNDLMTLVFDTAPGCQDGRCAPSAFPRTARTGRAGGVVRLDTRR
jgi:hypothetical protein